MSKWHAHYGSEARDCDGRYSEGFDFTATSDDPNCNPLEPDELDVIALAMRMLFHFPDVGPVNIAINRDSKGRVVITQSMETEEGYLAEEVTVCDLDDYDPEDRYFRDYTAESMGY